MRVAIWARVSTAEQHTENQLAILREWAQRCGDEVVREFIIEDSAWSSGNGVKGREFDKARADLIRGAHRAEYRAVRIWALDRLSRRGYGDLSSLMSQLSASGCDVLSYEEPFIHSLGPFGEIVIHMLSWIAQQSSNRSSQRIKAGIERARAEGRQLGGRKQGTRNRAPRPKLAGDAAGWTPERKAALAERNRQVEWTPERKLEMARISHRRACPVTDCMETRAHD